MKSIVGFAAPWLALCLFSFPPAPVRAEAPLGEPVSFAVTDANFQEIAFTIAINNHFRVLVAPELSRKNLSITFRDVMPLDALAQIAAGVDARLVKAPYMSRPFYLLVPKSAPAPVWSLKTRFDSLASMAVKDIDAVRLIRTLALNSGCNIVVDPAVPKKNLSINIEDVQACEAINAVADVCGYSVSESSNANGHPTYIVRGR